MDVSSDIVIEDALSLPADIRINLIEKLIQSLNLPINSEIDMLWSEEAERRVEQIKEGKAKLITGKEVFAKITSKYQK
ncbi:MAG: addiction module protein [Bacteroidales bacterium]|nr:addiction module protein [Bacteroidales bacterium]MCF8456560.1 addiction module protein [Bacteroidales bacterium]